jgi:hypothetical protein
MGEALAGVLPLTWRASANRTAASLARGKFTMSLRAPSPRSMRHMPG